MPSGVPALRAAYQSNQAAWRVSVRCWTGPQDSLLPGVGGNQRQRKAAGV